MTKETICNLLRAWINQRPGLEFANYGDVSAYRAELRSIAKDRQHALELLAYVSMRDGITAEMLEAHLTSGGRLTLTTDSKGKPALSYCTGQYFPTEYRPAACRVLASVIWAYWGDNMPDASGTIKKTTGSGPFMREYETACYGANRLSAGDYLRAQACREFNRAIASRWFN